MIGVDSHLLEVCGLIDITLTLIELSRVEHCISNRLSSRVNASGFVVSIYIATVKECGVHKAVKEQTKEISKTRQFQNNN
jgi:hypothetical protein